MTPIPTLRLVRHAYLDLIGGWRAFVQIGAPWLIVPWVLQSIGGPLSSLLADLAMSAGFAAIAVAWHRRLLLEEQPTGRLAPLNSRVGRYLVFSFLVLVVVAIPGLVLALLVTAGLAAGGGSAVIAVLGLAAVLLSLTLTMRLQLVFPATAVDDRTMTLAESWVTTRGQGLRLLGGLLLIMIPASLLGVLGSLALDALGEASGSRVLGWLAELAPILGAWVQAPLLAGFLSFVYVALRGGRRLPKAGAGLSPPG